MAVLVEDHVGVLRVVDAALAEAELEAWVVALERVVLPELVDPDPLRAAFRSARRVTPKPSELDVLLRLGDPEVRHDLLELVLVTRVRECVAR